MQHDGAEIAQAVALAATMAAWALFCARVLHTNARADDLREPLRLDRTSLLGITLAYPLALLGARDDAQRYALGILLVTLAYHSWTDRRFGVAYDELTLPAMLAVAATSLADGRASQEIFGAVIGGILLATAYYASAGKALGFPDVGIATLIGLALGPMGALAAFVLSAAIAVPIHLWRGKRRKDAVPYAHDLFVGSLATCLALPVLPVVTLGR
jgi:prepilin signal peptidase PulO-like enzyme (type II secretory pathway)